MVRRRFFFMVLALAIGCGIVVGGFMMHVALEHNPMGEYCDYGEGPSRSESCVIQWGPLGLLGALWFAATAIGVSIIYGIVSVLLRLRR